MSLTYVLERLQPRLKGVLNVYVGRCDKLWKNVRMEHFSALFSNLFPQKRKRISANTCTYFGKYAHVFPQIFLRISANKFSAELKRRFFLSQTGIVLHFVRGRDSLRLVPSGDMYTSLAGTKVCPRCGHSRALDVDVGMSQPRTRKDLGASAKKARAGAFPAFHSSGS